MAKPNRYKRSTPVVRLQRNVEKILRHGELVAGRLETWRSSENAGVLGAIVLVGALREQALKIHAIIEALDEGGFVPPRKQAAWQPGVGEHVAVLPKHRDKYAEALEEVIREDPQLLDDLLVTKITKAGEVVVRRGKRTPFWVRKSHLEPVRDRPQVRSAG